MDLDKAISDHAHWKAKLRQAITSRDRLDADSIGRDDCCNLGKWLHGEGRAKHGAAAAFTDVIASHKAFHVEAGKIARLINDGNMAGAVDALATDTPYARASQKTASAIMRLKREVA